MFATQVPKASVLVGTCSKSHETIEYGLMDLLLHSKNGQCPIKELGMLVVPHSASRRLVSILSLKNCFFQHPISDTSLCINWDFVFICFK